MPDTRSNITHFPDWENPPLSNLSSEYFEFSSLGGLVLKDSSVSLEKLSVNLRDDLQYILDELKNIINRPDSSYNVGEIYMSVNPTSPAVLYGGTWSRWGQGRVPVGVNESVTDFNTVGKEGGAATHVLTAAQLGSHTHAISAHRHGLTQLGSVMRWYSNPSDTGGSAEIVGATPWVRRLHPGNGNGRNGLSVSAATRNFVDLVTPIGSDQHTVVTTHQVYNRSEAYPNESEDVFYGLFTGSGAFSAGATTFQSGTLTRNNVASGSAGSGTAHNNLQPYITCFMWVLLSRD